MAKRGRPPGRFKSATICITLTPSEKESIFELARFSGMSVSAFLVRSAFSYYSILARSVAHDS